jgi:hypothetical protein
MVRLPLFFLAAAALCLTVGVCLGIWMGIRHDFHLAPVHAHLNLLGWTSLALIGLTYRAYPRLAENPVPALAQFGLSVASAFAFPFGIYLSIEHQAPALAISASLVWLAGTVLFLARLLILAFAMAPASTPGRAARLQPAE